MSISRARLDEYFTRYAATLTNLDAEAAADLWSPPGMIVDDRFSGVIDSRDAMVRGLEQSYPLYQQLGLDSVRYEVMGSNHLTDMLVLVLVKWKFFDAEGDLLTDSSAHYLLREEVAGLRATVCVQIDDAEKIRALAASRGIDLTSVAE